MFTAKHYLMKRYIAAMAFLFFCSRSSAQHLSYIIPQQTFAKAYMPLAAGSKFNNYNAYPKPLNQLSDPAKYAPRLSGNGSGMLYAGLCSTYELGAASSTIKYGNVTSKVNGLAWHLALGFNMHYGVLSDRRITGLSIELGYSHFATGGVVTDTTPSARNSEFKLGYIGIPITYFGYLFADRSVGFYYMLGINPQYLVDGKSNDKKYGGFKKLIAIPSASIGLAIPQESGRGGLNKIRMIGPYVSTSLGNLSSDNNIDFKCLTFGIRYYSTVIE